MTTNSKRKKNGTIDLDGWSFLSLEDNAQNAVVNARSPKTLNLNLTQEKHSHPSPFYPPKN